MTRSVSAEACLPLILPLPAASTNQRERPMAKVFPKLMRKTSQSASEAASIRDCATTAWARIKAATSWAAVMDRVTVEDWRLPHVHLKLAIHEFLLPASGIKPKQLSLARYWRMS